MKNEVKGKIKKYDYSKIFPIKNIKLFSCFIVLILLISSESIFINCSNKKSSKILDKLNKMGSKGFSKYKNMFARFGGSSGSSSTVKNYKMTLKDIREVVQTHNELRNNIAAGQQGLPKASNMSQMYWSQLLANNAQDWVNKNGCEMEHSNGYTYKGQRVGENCAMRAGSHGMFKETAFVEFVKNWYSEIKDFGNQDVSRFSGRSGGGVIGHFTQVIWSDSYLVGCGYCQKDRGGMLEEVMVCQYANGGNMIGDPIYTPGQQCQCPNGYGCQNPDYRSLCCPTVHNWCQKNSFLWFE